MVAGNHDLAACGKMGVEEFNPVAARAALWTRDVLAEVLDAKWLREFTELNRAFHRTHIPQD